MDPADVQYIREKSRSPLSLCLSLDAPLPGADVDLLDFLDLPYAEVERLLGQGQPVGEVVRELAVSESTWQGWQDQYSGAKADDGRELRALRKENQRVKKIVA